MEVHHHAHIPTSREKKWTHYFWEFIMLFLAVFAGFLAENQREHMIEHRREKQYMRSMIKDLEIDIVNIQKSIGDETRTIQIADTITEIFNNNDYRGFCNASQVVLYDRWDINAIKEFRGSSPYTKAAYN